MIFGGRRRRICTISSSIFIIIFVGLIIFITDLIINFKQRENICIDNISSNNDDPTSSSTNQVDLRSFVTTVRCIGPVYNQSCLYKNLYYVNRGFWALSLKESNLSLPGVRLEALATSDFRPHHRIFDTYEELHEFIRSKADPMVLPGLTIHFNQRWHRNIGHALFDGLYPAYVALIRFAPKHLQSFRVFVGLDTSQCESCFSEDVYSRFGGVGLIKSNVIDAIAPDRWYVFEELLLGSGMMCQRCIQSNYQLAGGVELDGSRLFRDRMYKQHGIIPPDVRGKHSTEKRNPKIPINAYIIHNKRFTEEEQIELKAALEEINKYTDENINKSIDEIKKLPYPLIRVIYLNYRNITAQNNLSSNLDTNPIDSRSPTYELIDNNFIAQLRVLRQMNIHLTGPGTGQMYQTFLSDGSVNINLGGMNPYKKERTPIAYPSFLEQYVTAGTPYIKGLYYPINKRRDGIKRTEVVKLIQQAAQMIMEGFSIPVNPKDNLAPDGKVFVDQCKNDKDFVD